MRHAVSITSNVLGSGTGFGPSAPRGVVVDATDRTGAEPI